MLATLLRGYKNRHTRSNFSSWDLFQRRQGIRNVTSQRHGMWDPVLPGPRRMALEPSLDLI